MKVKQIYIIAIIILIIIILVILYLLYNYYNIKLEKFYDTPIDTTIN